MASSSSSSEDLRAKIAKFESKLEAAEAKQAVAETNGNEALILMYGGMVTALHNDLSSLRALLPKPTAPSRSKHTGYKEKSARVDSRLICDTLAEEMYDIYDFPKLQKNVSIYDVIQAYWNKSATIRDPEQTSKPLHTRFTKKQIRYLDNLRRHSRDHLHGSIPRRGDGKVSVVLPHKLCNQRMLAEVMVESGIIDNQQDLVVTDEDHESLGSDLNHQ